MKPFSVLMSVYRNDNPAFFRKAVESISVRQTLKPSEILIIVDGPVPDHLMNEIQRLREEISEIRVIFLEKNGGLGNALRIGMEKVSHEIVARMDSDDISAPDRFEKQLKYLEEHPKCDIVGGQITEFIDDESNIVGKREVPCGNDEIVMWLRGRCPLNHMTVTMLRSRGLEAGNYIDWHFNEDYYLWIRMFEHGCRFANLPDTLVNVRVGKEMYSRRGGWKYFKSEKGLQDYMLQKGIIGWGRYCFNVAVRFGVQVMMPNSVRGFVFKTLFRKKS
ncbi:MAG: glycosyltransferase [Bacteroidales bacterium]|nr:glycosyltransferase [Bacteroidales bacterium]